MAETFFIFGCGYSGLAIAAELRRLYPACRLYATCRTAEKADLLRVCGLTPLPFDGAAFASAAQEREARGALQAARFCFISIAPAAGDPAPALAFMQSLPAAPPKLIYLSSIGVYGDSGGAWIDETAPLKATSRRGLARIKAEDMWAEWAQAQGSAALILRLGGIYGDNLAPAGFAANGRNPFRKLAEGKAQAIIKPGQVFNRIHVADIAAAACHLAGGDFSGIYNLTDGHPAPPQDLLNFAAALAGLPPPPAVPFAQADLSPAGRAFYADNRRVSNAKLRQSGYNLLYPDYKAGLTNIFQGQNW